MTEKEPQSCVQMVEKITNAVKERDGEKLLSFIQEINRRYMDQIFKGSDLDDTKKVIMDLFYDLNRGMASGVFYINDGGYSRIIVQVEVDGGNETIHVYPFYQSASEFLKLWEEIS